MDMSNFVVIGENIHCTRVYKRGGVHTTALPGGGEGLTFTFEGRRRVLPIPSDWAERSPAYDDGKIKHVAVAVYLAAEGAGEDAGIARDYLRSLAQHQIDAQTTFLDVNVDEYANDSARRCEVMTFLVNFLGEQFPCAPLSIDSSDPAVLAAGLAACRPEAGPHMVNSVSLERLEGVEVVAGSDAAVVVSAAGRDDMPATVEERLANFGEIIARLNDAGVAPERMHLDPLVLPLSTDPTCGRTFLDATRQAKAAFPGASLSGGLSNVSFGMPQRRLLNMVFTRLCVEAGSNSGILDPVSIGRDAVAALDTDSEPYRLAEAFLTGQDLYGMEFITAHREGRLG